MKYRYKILFCLVFSILFGCAANTAQQQEPALLPVSLVQALAPVECSADEFSGFGAGASDGEALNMAHSSLARQIHSSVKVSVKYTQSQKVSDGKESLDSDYASDTEVEALLANAHDARVLRIERSAGKVSVNVCMSRADAAKGIAERLKPVADSLEFSANAVIEAKRPMLKREAWLKTQPLQKEFTKLYYVIEGFDKEKAASFEPVGMLYAKARDEYLSYCQTAKLYWNPEADNLYSGAAFSKLSKNLKLEKSACEGHGVSLIYKNNAYKCEHAGIYKCSHRAFLLIASCGGEEYRLLESPRVESFQKKEEVAVERLHEKLGKETFWSEWEQEIKQWEPQCE